MGLFLRAVFSVGLRVRSPPSLTTHTHLGSPITSEPAEPQGLLGLLVGAQLQALQRPGELGDGLVRGLRPMMPTPIRPERPGRPGLGEKATARHNRPCNSCPTFGGLKGKMEETKRQNIGKRRATAYLVRKTSQLTLWGTMEWVPLSM